MATITDYEAEQIENANATGRTPVVFVHHLARRSADGRGGPANSSVLAKKTFGQVADHTAEVIGELSGKPVVMGHSTGGLATLEQLTPALVDFETPGGSPWLNSAIDQRSISALGYRPMVNNGVWEVDDDD